MSGILILEKGASDPMMQTNIRRKERTVDAEAVARFKDLVVDPRDWFDVTILSDWAPEYNQLTGYVECLVNSTAPSTAPIVSVAGHQIGYDAYTKGGDSGAGVFGTWSGVTQEHVCADHVAGPNGIPNTGSRLAQDKFDRIVNEWFKK